jgi:hypothetical protein
MHSIIIQITMPPHNPTNGCPYCHEPMRPVAMSCPACEVEIHGSFQQGLFQRLAPQEEALLEQYLLAGFSIKALAEETGMGYAALRTRIDKIIGHYRALRDVEEQKKQILEQVAVGKLDAAEAVEQIRQLRLD